MRQLIVFVLLGIPLLENLINIARLHHVFVTAPGRAAGHGKEQLLQLPLYQCDA